MRKVIVFFIVCLVAGCSTVPFSKTADVPVGGAEPLDVLHAYERRLPDHYRIMESVIIDYRWKKMSCLGLMNIDKGSDSFDLACFSPMGLKIFELSGSEKGIDRSFMIGSFEQKNELLRLIAHDIQMIYLDRVPSSSARIKKEKNRIVFSEASGRGRTEYIFGGQGAFLIKKSYYESDRLQWKISYHDYREKDGKIYPEGIMLKSYAHGYTLTLKLKEILN